MTSTNLAATGADAPELTISRRFNAERRRVFAAFTEAEQLAKWFGPAGGRCPNAEADARVGGRYRLPIVGDESGTTHTVVGEYLEVVDAEKLVFTWSWVQDDGNPGQRMVITLTFRDVDGGTELILHQIEFIDSESRDKHVVGWNSCLDCLDTFLATA